MWIMLKVTKLPPFPNDHPHSSSSASSWSFQVIQMNMEIALVCAQLCVMAGARAADNHDLVKIITMIIIPMTLTSDHFDQIITNHHQMELCRLISILTHLFYTTAFTFMFLEALHTYRCFNVYCIVSIKVS